MRKWTSAVPVAGAFALSAAAFARLPQVGRIDLSHLLPFEMPPGGPMSRLAAALLVPTVALAVWVLLTALARLEGPKRPVPDWALNESTGASSIRRFEPTFETMIFAVTALLALMHVALIGSLLGWPAWTGSVLTAIVGLGLIAAGNVMPRTRPNWIVGIRTKRTLSDPLAWSRVHRRLGALMIGAGALMIVASLLAPTYALAVGIVALLLSFAIAGITPASSPRA